MAAARNSDRWITPGVIVAALVVSGLVLVTVAAGVVYLAAQGIDPDPMIRLVAQVATSIGALGTLILQLANRATAAKTERNTGVLVGAVDELAAVVPAAVPAPDAQKGRPEPEQLPPYVVNLDDDPADGTGAYPRIPVPALPPMPKHLMRRRADQL